MTETTFDILMSFAVMSLLTVICFVAFLMIHHKEVKEIEKGGFDHE